MHAKPTYAKKLYGMVVKRCRSGWYIDLLMMHAVFAASPKHLREKGRFRGGAFLGPRPEGVKGMGAQEGSKIHH